jgi:membrane fusion protein (multidrug efflux system)
VVARRGVSGAVLAGLLCLHCDGRAPGPVEAPPPAEPAFEVSVVRVARGAITERISAPGSLLARRESHVGALVSGRIEHVFVSEGDRVEAGAPLFQIDPAPFAAALRAAEAGLDVARAERGQLEADLARARELGREQIVSRQQLDRLATSLAVARARERQAAEAVAIARQDLERTRVVAPYAGSVALRLADEGTTALVQPQTIVLVLQETAELEAQAAIPESQLQLIHPGDPARLFVEGIHEPIETAVAAVGDTIDPATRTYLVTMRVSNADHRLKAGVFARVEILPGTRGDALLVPRAALRTEEGRQRVLVVREGRAVAVPVELGVVSEELAEIVRGVEVGEPVIVGEAAGALAPGMRVRVVSEETAGAAGPAS